MSLHKIGGTVVTSTDNIVISKFSGIVEVGKYSNYQMVTNALNIVFGQIFNSEQSQLKHFLLKQIRFLPIFL